jgi:DNA-binding Lrp family transcriptional regulator
MFSETKKQTPYFTSISNRLSKTTLRGLIERYSSIYEYRNVGIYGRIIYITLFVHFRYDSKIIRFYTFLVRVISLTTCKMVSVLVRATE